MFNGETRTTCPLTEKSFIRKLQGTSCLRSGKYLLGKF